MKPVRKKGTSIACMMVLGLVALTLSPNSAWSGSKNLDLALCAPDQHTFTVDITNPFLPLSPVGRTWVLVGEEDGEPIGLQITVLNQTEKLYAGPHQVKTRVVEEFEWQDADLDGVIDADENFIEISRNYFAQTEEGTVCYFGEAVQDCEGRQCFPGGGAWRADDNASTAPGIFMPADPKPGMMFPQEVAPGVAEDTAKIVGTGPDSVPAGDFAETLRVEERNPLEGDKGYKSYARNVGIIRDATLELISY